MNQALCGIVTEHIRAINAFNTVAILATICPDAHGNDSQRDIFGIKAIRGWIEKEIVGEHVTMKVRHVRDHYGDPIVRAIYDGDYDKTNLPTPLIMTNYFRVRNGKIVTLFVNKNTEPNY